MLSVDLGAFWRVVHQRLGQALMVQEFRIRAGSFKPSGKGYCFCRLYATTVVVPNKPLTLLSEVS